MTLSPPRTSPRKSAITCARLIRLKRCSTPCWVSFRTRPSADLILQLTGLRFSDRVLMDREGLWRADGPINLEQRDITGPPGEPTGTPFPRGGLNQVGLGQAALSTKYKFITKTAVTNGLR
jgi:hypothetical protein